MATTTAARRREIARTEYDAFLAACPSRQLLDRLSDKWVGLVLAALSNGPQRYNEIARTVAGVSQKMLTQTLRTLERDGLATRTVTPTVPVRVDYELTDLGQSLQKPICGLATWATENVETIHAAQARFDAARDDAEAA